MLSRRTMSSTGLLPGAVSFTTSVVGLGAGDRPVQDAAARPEGCSPRKSLLRTYDRGSVTVGEYFPASEGVSVFAAVLSHAQTT